MVKQIFTLIENKVPPSCGAAILFHCTIHYTILLAGCCAYCLFLHAAASVDDKMIKFLQIKIS